MTDVFSSKRLFQRMPSNPLSILNASIMVLLHIYELAYRPLAGYGLPPPRGNFVNHFFLEAQCHARILQHVSPLTMAAFSRNRLLYTLPYKIFDN